MHAIAIQQSPYGILLPEEHAVIQERHTESPHSGKYLITPGQGVYCCRNCGKVLFSTDDQFDSRCGWPAFDDSLPEAVAIEPEESAPEREEISCAHCGAHLGHLFQGEHMTGKNQRYCVNSLSLVFEPQDSERVRRAVFAGGCFWGVEDWMARARGVISAVSGYTGGDTMNPTYRQVCSGRTGHYEAVEVFYNPLKTDYETLCRFFLEIHDPEQQDGQGPDQGPQYRSAIFYLDEQQKADAERLLNILREKGYRPQTKILPLQRFWNAEMYHQDYYHKARKRPYCHVWQKRF